MLILDYELVSDQGPEHVAGHQSTAIDQGLVSRTPIDSY